MSVATSRSASSRSSSTAAQLMPEIDLITDRRLREQTVRYWDVVYERSGWAGECGVGEIPYNTSISTSTLVDHSRSVARTAHAAASTARELYGISYDLDLLVSASILHDVCKILESDPDPDNPGAAVKSSIGMRLAHGIIGGYVARELGMPLDLEHMIVTHTPQSLMLPQTPEGVLLRHADVLDADVLYGNAGLPIFLGRVQ